MQNAVTIFFLCVFFFFGRYFAAILRSSINKGGKQFQTIKNNRTVKFGVFQGKKYKKLCISYKTVTQEDANVSEHVVIESRWMGMTAEYRNLLLQQKCLSAYCFTWDVTTFFFGGGGWRGLLSIYIQLVPSASSSGLRISKVHCMLDMYLRVIT